MTAKAVREATAAAYDSMSPNERLEIMEKARQFVKDLKAIRPSSDMSIQSAFEVIGAVYAWDKAHKPGLKNAHLCTLAKEPQPPAKTS
jgi:hypothetical protein